MTLLIGERYRSKLVQSLGAQGIDVFWLPDNPALDPRLVGHADLSIFVCRDRAVVASKLYSSNIVNYLTNMGYKTVCSGSQGSTYPRDAGLCVCRTGKYTILNPRTAEPAVQAVSDGVFVTVAQGYTRCAVLAVDERSIITADAGVSSAAKSVGLDVLDITPGHIALEGYEYGFIGGAAFILSDDTVAFTGTLDGHPDKERVIRFLAERGQRAVFLTEEPIFDIGGAIPV